MEAVHEKKNLQSFSYNCSAFMEAVHEKKIKNYSYSHMVNLTFRVIITAWSLIGTLCQHYLLHKQN